MATVITNEKVVAIVQSGGVDGGAVPPLGAPQESKRFWFQRTKRDYDPDATATQLSVFDDPTAAEQYAPPSNWENIGRFDPMARWTWREEVKLIRKVDLRIMLWACIMFMSLQLDRANLGQALTDNFLNDLGLTTADYNLGSTVQLICFILAELPSQLVSKWVGVDRWVPTEMVLWSLVSGGQFWLSGRASFLTCRALLGFLMGGFIPDHHELSIRLGFFWTGLNVASIIASLMAYGLLHMRGVAGIAGWRWMFLIEGLITLIVGLFSYLLMPPGPCQTASWFRGKDGWFSERIIREDPSKSSMHNRQPVTPRLLWESLKDYDMWPIYLLGMLYAIPWTPLNKYLTLSLTGLGFNSFQSNLLTIPATAASTITLLAITYTAEVLDSLTYVAMFGQFWVLPFLVWLEVAYTSSSDKWQVYAIMILLLSYPNRKANKALAEAIHAAWNSRNSNAVRLRTVSTATYNIFQQLGGIIGSNIYQPGDAPLYRQGNKVLLGMLALNVVVYLSTKAYYVFRNKQRSKKWDSMSEEERLNYLQTTTDEGNKRLDFRFAH
ncbi:major facilitator superfamily domain-containing protein [Xylariales sp. PMI_506]|nr:major facilitator superfamily domain-containing protein [Xylariales sp. PMI_506]